MKVGIFSPYFQTFGGGERYVLTVAEFFLKRKWQVDIFWNGDKDIGKIKKRFDIDLSQANFIRDIFHNHTNFFQKILSTVSYDLIFFLSDGSIPFSLAKKNILHFQQPFHYTDQQTFLNKIKLFGKKIVCNSYFTKKFIDQTYGVKSGVLYPPIDIRKFSVGRKTNQIISVGRFFGPSNPKKHEILIKTFKQMVEAGLKNWKLVLIGGTTLGSEVGIKELRAMANGYPIKIITDSSFLTLQYYYSTGRVYWHATGFDENLEKHPERAEHFGITTVEAMSAGCIPVVFSGGGQKEIVTEGKNGYFWKTPGELTEKTLTIINNTNLQEKIAKNALNRAKDFSKERFFRELESML